MAIENSDPEYQAALDILEGAKQGSLSMEVRKSKCIDLASHMLVLAKKNIKKKERRKYEELNNMIHDPQGKAFLTSMTDQCFRSSNPFRVADQLIYLMDLYGVPRFLSPWKRFGLYLIHAFGHRFAKKLIPLAMHYIRKEFEAIIISGEPKAVKKHIHRRRQEGVSLNLNHLGEAVLSKQQAQRQLNLYLEDLKNESVEYISVKISTLFSQINLVSWEETLENLAERLRILYRAAMSHMFEKKDGTRSFKFVNLDMEEYKDLHLTKELFIKVLSEEEFFHFSAGIALQAYLPDSIHLQKEITAWAKERIAKGGAPIKIRIVKGANLGMEQVKASEKLWPQAPYKSKHETDANFKKMLIYGITKENAEAAHLGIASHNLFDIAFALLLRAENSVEKHVSFEMLEGMAENLQRVVHKLSGSMLLYCAVATKEDFPHAMAYLFRRLDENAGRENFLRHFFDLKPDSKEWEDQAAIFLESCDEMQRVSSIPRRNQNRQEEVIEGHEDFRHFENEPDTDFSLAGNRVWAKRQVEKWRHKKHAPIPLVINGKDVHQENPSGKGFDPSEETPLYSFSMANLSQIDEALQAAENASRHWQKISMEKKMHIIHSAANLIKSKRGDLICAMIADGGKTFLEADPEVSEAIDFCRYYLSCMWKIANSDDLEASLRGTTLVVPPWNFPVSIPCGCISAALITGNPVLFKPSSLSVLAAYELVKVFWEAGIPKDLLQFIPCDSETVGKKLIQDPRLKTVALTGSSDTARLFMKLRPDLNLIAETGGKNPIILTDLCDRDLAIESLVHSAFGHNGQKCSAASLAILEKEIYDDPHFMRKLKDAAASLKVGSNWDLAAKITPLIRAPDEMLLRGLTTLDPGEEWLLQPHKDPKIPNLWSPGIKMGVKKGSFMHMTELFGPVLGLMRADNLDHAILLANGTPYGLTSGIQTLDEREKRKWKQLIVAGNCYINRKITGSIVQRQPFGGTKASSFGQGYKAGGPNYINQYQILEQKGIPKEKFPVNEQVNILSGILDKFDLSGEDLTAWYTSASNYAFWWKRLQYGRDPSKVVGEDNLLLFVPHKKMCIRIYKNDRPLDYLRIFAAALTCGAPLQISFEKIKSQDFPPPANWGPLLPACSIFIEEEEAFLKRIKAGDIKRVRLLTAPSEKLLQTAAEKACFINTAPVLANGRYELFHYLREVSISHVYHRYGNLGIREDELRKPVL